MAIPGFTDSDLLDLWEGGSRRHPLDRALLLYSWAYPQQPRETLADLPLGTIQRALLALRSNLFGPRIEAWQDCPACGSRQEIQLDASELLSKLPDEHQPLSIRVLEHNLRLPCSRDLAALIEQPDPQLAARQLLKRCLLSSPSADSLAAAEAEAVAASMNEEQLAAVDAALEAADPAADIALKLNCSDCGQPWSTSLDISGLLWGEITARAQALLLEIHQLARAYGWGEPQILAIPAWRRAAYLNLVAP
jgi:hypothetical protein